MWETDDRLSGDPVWELFQPLPATRTSRPWIRWAVAAAVVGLGLSFYPAIAVAAVCLVVAWGDLVHARQARRSIPDPAAGRISALFSYGWGLWKIGMTAFGLMFTIIPFAGRPGEVPASFIAAALLWMLGFAGSALVTASGLFVAIRKGMRVWVGQGVNQARTLLLTMLTVGFTVCVLVPLFILLGDQMTRGHPDGRIGEDFAAIYFQVAVFGSMFAAPVVLLLILDAVSKRVIADRPTKYGPKVAAVGKWVKPGPSQAHISPP